MYVGLKDRLFGVPGEWSYEECRRCGLVFLDPRPTKQDIGEAYTASYPTHHSAKLRDNLLRRFRSYVRGGYLAHRFGYLEGVGPLQRLAGRLIYLHPGQRESMNGSIMYLPAEKRGRVLDVGSGAGRTLSELRRLGWQVEGVDLDARAVEAAMRDYGLASVRVGTLHSLAHSPDSFDAVVMSHVIEHIHAPVELLKECRRILKPGGMLVVATPNAEGLGRRWFGKDWRVLEPPGISRCSPDGRSPLRRGRVFAPRPAADHSPGSRRKLHAEPPDPYVGRHARRTATLLGEGEVDGPRLSVPRLPGRGAWPCGRRRATAYSPQVALLHDARPFG